MLATSKILASDTSVGLTELYYIFHGQFRKSILIIKDKNGLKFVSNAINQTFRNRNSHHNYFSQRNFSDRREVGVFVF